MALVMGYGDETSRSESTLLLAGLDRRERGVFVTLAALKQATRTVVLKSGEALFAAHTREAHTLPKGWSDDLSVRAPDA